MSSSRWLLSAATALVSQHPWLRDGGQDSSCPFLLKQDRKTTLLQQPKLRQRANPPTRLQQLTAAGAAVAAGAAACSSRKGMMRM